MAKAGPRKKLPKEIAIINADNCTGCESCLEVCPVDCIVLKEMHHGVKGNQSWCEIDIERCVGCEVCVHIPQKKTNPYELTVCPWNAIEMVPTELAAQYVAVRSAARPNTSSQLGPPGRHRAAPGRAESRRLIVGRASRLPVGPFRPSLQIASRKPQPTH